jgi:hypothetical protein
MPENSGTVGVEVAKEGDVEGGYVGVDVIVGVSVVSEVNVGGGEFTSKVAIAFFPEYKAVIFQVPGFWLV